MVESPLSHKISGLPQGGEAFFIQDLLKSSGDILFVCRNEARLYELMGELSFFLPEQEILLFPAWDCVPYDRLSPHKEILSKRCDTLTRLSLKSKNSRILLTTLKAICQKIPPKETFENFAITVGKEVGLENLTKFLSDNGYLRVEVVREVGEFSLRGGLIDIFPGGAKHPLRLDLFGEELESLKTFDPLTQRTLESLESFHFHTNTEVVLNQKSITKFRSSYHTLLKQSGEKDPLYQSISEGRPYVGQEHWLPLFYDELVTLDAYLEAPRLILDDEVEARYHTFLEQVHEHYEERLSLLKIAEKEDVPYFPIPPETLFVEEASWKELLEKQPTYKITPFVEDVELTPHLKQQNFNGKSIPNFYQQSAREKKNVFEVLKTYLKGWPKSSMILFACYSISSLKRLHNLLVEHQIFGAVPLDIWKGKQKGLFLTELNIEKGYAFEDMLVISEQDLFGERIVRKASTKKPSNAFFSEVSSWEVGDFIVHTSHGIGKYLGLKTLQVDKASHDCLLLEYAGGDKLFVPAENMDALSRFGSKESITSLDKLGGTNWHARKEKAKKRIKEIADKLLKVAADRLLQKADVVMKPEGLYDEFAARFPYLETEDQLRAIEDVVEDLSSGRPMDRLICGDVGFGKTEVALRAAFIVAATGKQVALLTPTTLLCRQHFASFQKRFEGFPLTIRQLSRFTSAKDMKAYREEMAEGKADIIIATHSILSKNTKFKDLGLVIVDEEQHFGVEQKEKLKDLKHNVHLLTLSATPIPRTLQMSLAGIRDMSLIGTPPVDRLAVRTFVMPYDGMVLKEALYREHYRNGQSFYVCPRLSDIADVGTKLSKLVPDLKIAVAHGKLSPKELEDVMTAFTDKKYDVLLATNIVESGLDIPSANTLIIHRADMFGLAQLYQLRGRVGRGKVRGYAYLTYSQNRVLSNTAKRRLEVMQTLDNLGAGFSLASHDMDIRGAGNLLGEEQSGHIKEIGVELYQKMLEEAVAAQKETAQEERDWTPQIRLGFSVLIPESYVADLGVRLSLYQRLSHIREQEEISEFKEEMIDRFGQLPEEVENLFESISLKILCLHSGIEKLDVGPKGLVIRFWNNTFSNPLGLIEYINNQQGMAKLHPDHRLVITKAWADFATQVKGVKSILSEIIKLKEAS